MAAAFAALRRSVFGPTFFSPLFRRWRQPFKDMTKWRLFWNNCKLRTRPLWRNRCWPLSILTLSSANRLVQPSLVAVRRPPRVNCPYMFRGPITILYTRNDCLHIIIDRIEGNKHCLLLTTLLIRDYLFSSQYLEKMVIVDCDLLVLIDPPFSGNSQVGNRYSRCESS